MKNLNAKKSKNLSGNRIYLKRVAMRMSQVELANRMKLHGIDIEREAISKIETGNRCVTDYELLILAKIFDVSMEWLVNGESDQTKHV